MTNKELNNQIDNLQAVQNITDVYQQVAAMRMRKVRDGIVNSREFYQKLSEIYLESQACYREQHKATQHHAKNYARETNGKSVSVLLSSNTGLYGSVIKAVFKQFADDTATTTDDLIITGQLGRNWFQVLAPTKPFKYFNLADGTDNLDAQLRQIFEYLAKYSNVKVYHGLFRNIAEQQVKVTTLTQQLAQKTTPGPSLSFLFEPGVDKVLQTFEEQLLYAFFDQAVYESALSKYGSRMLSLDSATQNISKLLAQSRLMSGKMRHLSENKKQQEATRLWNIQ
jgi:ATP synthase F1 gamma subunit